MPRTIVWAAPMFSPWIDKSDAGYEGILYDILSEAANRAKLELVINPTPIMRMYSQLDSGAADFSVIPILDPQNHVFPSEHLYTHSAPMYRTVIRVYAHRDHHLAEDFSPSTLSEYRLGTMSIPDEVRSITSMPEFIKREMELIGFKDDIALAKALKTGRIDLALAASLSFLTVAVNLGLEQDVFEVQGLESYTGNYVVWSKKSEKTLGSKLTQAFFEALSEVSCDGTVERIFKAWAVKEFGQRSLSDEVITNISGAIVGYCEE